MKILRKGIFTIKSADKDKANDSTIHIDKDHLKLEKLTYKEHGYNQSLKNKGNPTVFSIYIRKIFEGYKEEVREDVESQERAKMPHKVKMEGLLAENKGYREQIDEIENSKKANCKEKIEILNNRIREIKEHPENITHDKIKFSIEKTDLPINTRRNIISFFNIN
ncbi:MAG: hypothetical protein ACMUHX_09875 [bacterium]